MTDTEKLKKVAERREITINLPSIGLGTMRTSATYAALLIQLEGDRWQQVDVIDSVMEALGIHPEEIAHNRKRPDCVREDAFREWEAEGEELRQKLDAIAGEDDE